MPEYKLSINETIHTVKVEAATPLQWVLRDYLGLTGTKFGCGIGQCGSCMVHLNGKAVNSCLLPVAAVQDQKITTIEGLMKDDNIHPLQKAWIDEQVAQCGYCQSGQIMTALALLNETPRPSDEEINTAMSRNLCRCGTYPRIKKAIKRAIKK